MSNRYGTEYRDRLEFDFWLTFGRDPSGGAPSVRATAGYPALSRNERAMNVKVALPMALFQAPSLTATISIPADTAAPVIDIGATAEAIRQATGLDFDIRIGNGS